MGTHFETNAGLGGARRDRTADLLHAMQALSQLSYSPTREARNVWKRFRHCQETLFGRSAMRALRQRVRHSARAAVRPSQPSGREPVGHFPASTTLDASASRSLRLHEPIAALRHGDRTLRVLAQRQTGNAEIGRLFLHAAGIRD